MKKSERGAVSFLIVLAIVALVLLILWFLGVQFKLTA